MKLTITVDDGIAESAHKKAESENKTIEQIVIEFLSDFAIKADNEEFRQLSGRGHSQGWKFNRDEIHERK